MVYYMQSPTHPCRPSLLLQYCMRNVEKHGEGLNMRLVCKYNVLGEITFNWELGINCQYVDRQMFRSGIKFYHKVSNISLSVIQRSRPATSMLYVIHVLYRWLCLLTTTCSQCQCVCRVVYTIQSGDGPLQKFVIVCFNNVLMKYYALHIMLFE